MAGRGSTLSLSQQVLLRKRAGLRPAPTNRIKRSLTLETNNMDSKDSLQLCLKEIEMVQNNIARYDQNGMTIKSWCITIWSALIAYSIQNHDARIALIGVVIVMGFGFNELIYRSFQGRFIQRSGEVE